MGQHSNHDFISYDGHTVAAYQVKDLDQTSEHKMVMVNLIGRARLGLSLDEYEVLQVQPGDWVVFRKNSCEPEFVKKVYFMTCYKPLGRDPYLRACMTKWVTKDDQYYWASKIHRIMVCRPVTAENYRELILETPTGDLGVFVSEAWWHGNPQVSKGAWYCINQDGGAIIAHGAKFPNNWRPAGDRGYKLVDRYQHNQTGEVIKAAQISWIRSSEPRDDHDWEAGTLLADASSGYFYEFMSKEKSEMGVAEGRMLLMTLEGKPVGTLDAQQFGEQYKLVSFKPKEASMNLVITGSIRQFAPTFMGQNTQTKYHAVRVLGNFTREQDGPMEMVNLRPVDPRITEIKLEARHLDAVLANSKSYKGDFWLLYEQGGEHDGQLVLIYKHSDFDGAYVFVNPNEPAPMPGVGRPSPEQALAGLVGWVRAAMDHQGTSMHPELARQGYDALTFAEEALSDPDAV